MMRIAFCAGLMLISISSLFEARAAEFRVATYNVENYLDSATESRTVKTAESRAKVCESILKINPDIIALEEMGGRSALEELRGELKKKGLDLPHSEHVSGFDTNVFVAVLSKFPFVEKRSHTNLNYLLNGRRFKVSRGFAELDIQVTPSYKFTLLSAHLKSKRVVPEADEAEMRLEEAKLLRERVDAILARDPEANVLVAGDFNDTRDSMAVRALIGRGRGKLVDTRPAEKNGDNLPNSNPAWDPRNITWTHYYGKEDSYSRIDYILLSKGMAEELVKEETFILTIPNWGLASDHRPIVATFNTGQ